MSLITSIKISPPTESFQPMRTRVNSPTNDTETLNRAGLRWLVWSFRFYGLRITDAARPIHWCQAGFVLLITFAAFLSTFGYILIWLFRGKPSVRLVCGMLTIFCCIVCPPAAFLHACLRFAKYRQFIVDLAVCINEIPRAQDRAVCVRKAECLVKLTMLASVMVSICGFVGSSLGLDIKSKEMVEDEVESFAQILLHRVVVGFWHLFAMSFVSFYTCFVLLSCSLLIMCFDMHMPQPEAPNDFQSIYVGNAILGDQMICHRRLSILVKQANEIFSFYMLMALITEILAIIVYWKLHDGQFGGRKEASAIASFGVFFGYFLAFTSKIVVCSQLNNKVVTSLEINSLPLNLTEMQSFNGAHIYYHLYQIQQLTNNAAITYGGFFAVKKEFIFTIAGVVLTYALVLQDVNIS